MIEKVQIKDATLYLGDCHEVFPLLTKADAVVIDPPYGIGENSKKVVSRENKARPNDYGEFHWDESPCSPEQITRMRAMSRYQIIFGGNYCELPPTACWLIWDKMNTGDFADCEIAWTNMQKAIRRIQWRWNGFIRQGNEVRYHPTQKPLEVMKWCINHLLDDCHTILDPFMGSGTTGVACAKMGRRFIGIERKPKYFEIACKRISEAYDQPDIFVMPAVQEQPKPADLFSFTAA
jgi:DNA modification methylase